MKKDDYIYLFLAFILGYFTQSIIKQRCGTIIEGVDNSENQDCPEAQNDCCKRALDSTKTGDFVCRYSPPPQKAEELPDPRRAGGVGIGANILVEGDVFPMTLDTDSFTNVKKCSDLYNAAVQKGDETKFACNLCDPQLPTTGPS